MSEDIVRRLDPDNFSMQQSGCTFNIVNDTDGATCFAIRYTPENRFLYAFSPSKGLCKVTEYGGILEDNVLLKLVSLPDDDVEALSLFFQNHGFLVPLPSSGYCKVDLLSLKSTVERLKTAFFLRFELEKDRPNYTYILRLMLLLLIGNPIKLVLADDVRFVSCPHRSSGIIEKTVLRTDLIGRPDFNTNDGTIDIPDTIYSPTYKLSEDEYSDIVDGENFMFNYPGIVDMRYRKITSAYASCWSEGKTFRQTIDFLFHYMHEVGVIKSVDYTNGIMYYGEPRLEAFSTELKRGLLSTAKIVLSTEINYYSQKIKPYFDAETMTHTWKSPYFLSALYFSLSYMKPKNEILRACANPSCHQYFMVKITNTKKIFCCDKCRNAAEQREHRKRKK